MPRPRNTPTRLWSKIIKKGPNDCWLWTGPFGTGGYGRIEIDKRAYYVHRIIYSLANPGEIKWRAPRNKFASGFIRHTCDNPPCCNPKHLIVGTHLENMRDKVKRGRIPDFSGGKSKRCLLTMEDAFWVRMHHKCGVTYKALGLLYGASPATIKQIFHHIHYKEK